MLVLIAWAGVDYLLTWRQSESKLRMSHDEVKREHKENEGSPFTKGQVRRRQRQCESGSRSKQQQRPRW